MKKVTLEIPDGKALKFKDGAYVLVDDNVMERIKTWEDVVEALGYDPADGKENLPDDVIAYIKMRAIVEVLNEGWKPTFKDGETRYYPYYWQYTKSEWESLSASRRKELEPTVCLVGGDSDNGSLSGPLYVHSSYAWSIAHSGIGARLAFRTGELARYAGKQFFDIFKVFYYDGVL